MKYVTALLLLVLCFMGVVTMVLLIRDTPQYADGEPIAIIKDRLQKYPTPSESTPTDTIAVIVESETIWTEEYLGKGKWLVSNAVLPSEYSQSDLTFEEWIAKTKGWSATRLQEYASDLSPEEQESFREQMRTYNSGQSEYMDVLDQWYVYEKSGLVEKIQ